MTDTKTTYRYRTDAMSGSIQAESLHEALELLDSRENISDLIAEGAWAWVEGADGDRLYIGRENMA